MKTTIGHRSAAAMRPEADRMSSFLSQDILSSTPSARICKAAFAACGNAARLLDIGNIPMLGLPMRTFYLLVATAAVLATSSASAQTTEAANKDKLAPAAIKVCREVITTGSIMPGRKECHTRSEWARIDDKNHDNAQNATDRNRGRLMPARQDLDR